MSRSFFRLLRDELTLFLFDKWLLALVTLIPALLMLLICSIFENGVVRELPVAVVDMDNTSVSRALVRAIDASPEMKVRTDYLSVHEAVHAMRDAKVYAVVSISPKFTEKVVKHESPTVDAFYNTQFVLVGRTLASSLQKVVTTASVTAAVVRDLSRGQTTASQAMADSMPLQHQITPLYNPGSHYDQFLVSALIPSLWQILIMAIMVLSFSAQHRRTGIAVWIDKTGLGGFLTKLLVNQVIFLAMGAGFLYYFYQYRHWPMQGSWRVLIISQYLMILATQAVASLMYFIALDPARALSLSAGYVAPAFAFIGITFPANSMALFPQIWRALLPITHYMRIQVMQVNYGADQVNVLPEALYLALFSLVFIFVWLRVRMLHKGGIK